MAWVAYAKVATSISISFIVLVFSMAMLAVDRADSGRVAVWMGLLGIVTGRWVKYPKLSSPPSRVKVVMSITVSFAVLIFSISMIVVDHTVPARLAIWMGLLGIVVGRWVKFPKQSRPSTAHQRLAESP